MCIQGSLLCSLGQAPQQGGNLTAPPAQIPTGLSAGTINKMRLLIPFGVMLAFVTMGVIGLLVYLVNRRQIRLVIVPPPPAAAADEEEGGRCSLDSDCPPYLPKLPVIILGPDGSKGLSLGWQLQHTPCGSPTCLASSSSGLSFEDDKEGKQGEEYPAASPASPASSRAARTGEAAMVVVADAVRTAPPPAASQPAFSSRRRPPLISIEVLSPDNVSSIHQEQPAPAPAPAQELPPCEPQAPALQHAVPADCDSAATARC